jgi:hypothetical protein
MDKNVWAFFDHCYVITTTGSKYINEIQADLERVGIQNIDVWEFTPLRDKNDGGNEYNIWNFLIYGSNPDPISVDISKSHLKIIQDALNKGYQNILVFEDDARFDPIMPIIINSQWLKHNHWDIFYFGCMVFPPLFNSKITDGIDKTIFPMGSHAYAMSRSGMVKVLADSHKITDEHVPIDSYYRNNFNLDKYMVYPSINNQCKPPALYQRTANLLGLDYIIDYYQCYHIVNWLSHWSFDFIIFIIFIIFIYIFILIKSRVLLYP